MLVLSSTIFRSWTTNQIQQNILFGISIFLRLIFLNSSFIHSTWIFHDFIRIILIFLTIYLLLIIKLIAKRRFSLNFLLILLTVDLIFVFSVQNILLFYILFEFSLIPISLIILGWGFQPERLSARLYILFYTISSSFPFLGLIFYFNNPYFSNITNFLCERSLISFFILLPFLVKLPIFITHLWLPKAHVEAPAYGSIVLAGVLLKLGSFGIWRLYPLLSNFSLILASFSLIGAAICGLFVNIQSDVKAIIAYSRVVHIGLLAFCLIFGSPLAILSALIIIIAHGICSSGLFCLVTLTYERINSRRIVISQGIISFIPIICIFFSLLLIINLRAPPSLNLLSEVNIIYSSLRWNFLIIFWTALLILFSLIYRLVLFYSFFHGRISKYFSCKNESKKEIFLSFFHAHWWISSPLVIYLFEI